MARKLIEKYRRKPDFDLEYCTPVGLADGQEWYLPRPWLEVHPIFRDGKAVNCTEMLTCGELDPLLKLIGEEGDDPLRQSMHVLTLGALLLQRNYDVEDAELSRLFILRPGDSDSDRMITSIIDVATGNTASSLGWKAIVDPKVLGGGSEPV
jgi:hypothetical protein